MKKTKIQKYRQWLTVRGRLHHRWIDEVEQYTTEYYELKRAKEIIDECVEYFDELFNSELEN